jgi:hypothetical protein
MSQIYYSLLGGGEDVDFGVDFCCWNSNKLQKIEFGEKNQLRFQCVHTCFNNAGYINILYIVKEEWPIFAYS